MKYIEIAKKNRKRILSSILCAAMLFTSVNIAPVQHVHAEELESETEMTTEMDVVPASEEITEGTSETESVSEEITEETDKTESVSEEVTEGTGEAESVPEEVTEETGETESVSEEITEETDETEPVSEEITEGTSETEPVSEEITDETSDAEFVNEVNFFTALALSSVTFMNNDYPYGKSATRTDITLVADVVDASAVGTVQWQCAPEKDGVYEDIPGADSLTYHVSEPKDGYWYRCIVNGISTTKSVMLIKSGDAVMKSMVAMTKENFNGYWYVSNGVMCYTSINSWRSTRVLNFDVMGLYNLNGTLYWMNTSYSRGWQLYTNAASAPAAVKASDWGYGWDEDEGAALDALRVSFNSSNEHIVEVEADLAEGERSFAVGADVMLSDYSVTKFCDYAALKTVFDDNNIIKQIQMVGAARTEDAVNSDPALVLKFDSTPAYYWVGYYYDRLAFSQNIKSTIESYYYDKYIYSGTRESDYVIGCQEIDSGLVASYTNIPSGGIVKFSFGVGSVAQAGAQISISCGVQTNGESTDSTGGMVEVEGTTITANPSNKYSVFDGWYTEDGEKLTSENAPLYGIDSIEDNQLALNPATKSINVVARFNQNYIVTYNMDGTDGLPEGTVDGIDEGADNKGYSVGSSCEFPYKSRIMATLEPLKTLKVPYMVRNPMKWGFFRLKRQ